MITLHFQPTLTDRVTRLRACFSTFNYAQRLLVHYVNNLQFPRTLSPLLFGTFSTSTRSRKNSKKNTDKLHVFFNFYCVLEIH